MYSINNAAKIILGLFILSFSFSVSFSQAYSDGDIKVIVMFQEGVADFDEFDKAVGKDAVRYQKPQLAEAVKSYNVLSISKAMPNFKKSDAVRITKTGDTVYLTDWSNAFIYHFLDQEEAQRFIDDMNSQQGVVYAEKYIPAPKLFGWPNDPLYEDNFQWHLHNNGTHAWYTGLTEDADIDAPEAWQITTGSEDVTIGIVDTGVEGDNPDLAGKISGDIDFDSRFHGTDVAGIAGAIGNNDTLVAGINWVSPIVSKNGADYDYIAAIYGAVNAGSDVINFSLGYAQNYISVQLAIMDAYKSNVTLVAAMGNDAAEYTNYPAGYDGYVIAVGSTNWKDHPTYTSTWGNHIDVCAPGSTITTTCTRHLGSWTAHFGGTSAAAPVVTGIASLLYSLRLDLDNNDVLNLIKLSAEDIYEPEGTEVGWDAKTGEGRVNAYEALKYLQPPYSLDHISANATGATVTTIGGGQSAWTTFYQIPPEFGLLDGSHLAIGYKVTKSVTFSRNYIEIPHAWGRHAVTRGYTSDDPNFCVGYTEVSSVTQTGCTLTSYVYKIINFNGAEICWLPCHTNEVLFRYSVLGIDEADILPPVVEVTEPNGGEYYTTGQNIPISWEIGHLFPEETLSDIYLNAYPGGFEIIEENVHVNGEGQGSYNYRVPFGSRIDEHCKIFISTDDGINPPAADYSEGEFTIEYRMKPNDDPDPPIPGKDPIPFPSGPMEVTENFLAPPAPNPFNPQTLIRFGLKEPANVSLAIYDSVGRLVKTIYGNQHMNAGVYSETWDGKNNQGSQVISGIYFLRLKVGEYSKTHKLILVK